MLSWVGHGAIALALVGGYFWNLRPHIRPVDIEIVDMPKAPLQPVTLARPKPAEEPKARQVFGVSRKSVTADSGLDVKQGSTLAKTPDNEKLNPNDADSLPIPTEDYLVTQMPQLEKEVVIPYPPAVKARGVQGVVTMDLLIDASGAVRKVDLVDGPDPELNQAAVKAAEGFKFRPAKIQDRAVAVRIRYAYRFVIRG
jgi:TonB family protein